MTPANANLNALVTFDQHAKANLDGSYLQYFTVQYNPTSALLGLIYFDINY